MTSARLAKVFIDEGFRSFRQNVPGYVTIFFYRGGKGPTTEWKKYADETGWEKSDENSQGVEIWYMNSQTAVQSGVMAFLHEVWMRYLILVGSIEVSPGLSAEEWRNSDLYRMWLDDHITTIQYASIKTLCSIKGKLTLSFDWSDDLPHPTVNIETCSQGEKYLVNAFGDTTSLATTKALVQGLKE